MNKYQPSNGTEGDAFISKYCMNCRSCDPDSEGFVQCEILMRTMLFDIKEEKYPKEWCYIDRKPACTKFERWDWEIKGVPPVKEVMQEERLF